MNTTTKLTGHVPSFLHYALRTGGRTVIPSWEIAKVIQLKKGKGWILRLGFAAGRREVTEEEKHGEEKWCISYPIRRRLALWLIDGYVPRRFDVKVNVFSPARNGNRSRTWREWKEFSTDCEWTTLPARHNVG